MKNYRVVISPFAEIDLTAGKEWYMLHNDGLVKDFITEIEKTILRIQDNPMQFKQVKRKSRMAMVQRFPYGIFFYVKEDLINIFAVFHFSRHPKIWKKRIK